MKRILMVAVLFAWTTMQAQDAAVEERLNKLGGYIEELQAAKVGMDKRMTALVKELESVRDANKSGAPVATQEDIQRLAEAIKEVDRKRLEDYEKIHKELEKLARALSAPLPATKAGAARKERERETPAKDAASAAGGGGGAEKGFEHIVAAGDTLSTIAQVYREQLKIKITVDQILKANPGLKPNALIPGKKIFIPASEK
jgi:LysM repeat protein